MTLLVLGCRGQLGRALMPVLTGRGHAVAGVDREEVDITDARALAALVREVGPGIIVNCAAYTAVDRAEQDRDQAFAVNGASVSTLAGLADENHALLVQVSTDYVFDGRQQRPYREDDALNPLSVYGMSKLAGEEAARGARRHLVLRTAWLYGHGGANFVGAVRRQVEGGATELRVVDDQWGSPTFAGDLAWAVAELVAVEATGVVHVVNEGATTWCGFAREILRQMGSVIPVAPITTREANRPAPRPANSVLDPSRLRSLLCRGLPPWQDGLTRYLAGETSASGGGERTG